MWNLNVFLVASNLLQEYLILVLGSRRGAAPLCAVLHCFSEYFPNELRVPAFLFLLFGLSVRDGTCVTSDGGHHAWIDESNSVVSW